MLHRPSKLIKNNNMMEVANMGELHFSSLNEMLPDATRVVL